METCLYRLCRTMYPDRPADLRKGEIYCSIWCFLQDQFPDLFKRLANKAIK